MRKAETGHRDAWGVMVVVIVVVGGVIANGIGGGWEDEQGEDKELADFLINEKTATFEPLVDDRSISGILEFECVGRNNLEAARDGRIGEVNVEDGPGNDSAWRNLEGRGAAGGGPAKNVIGGDSFEHVERGQEIGEFAEDNASDGRDTLWVEGVGAGSLERDQSGWISLALRGRAEWRHRARMTWGHRGRSYAWRGTFRSDVWRRVAVEREVRG